MSAKFEKKTYVNIVWKKEKKRFEFNSYFPKHENRNVNKQRYIERIQVKIKVTNAEYLKGLLRIEAKYNRVLLWNKINRAKGHHSELNSLFRILKKWQMTRIVTAPFTGHPCSRDNVNIFIDLLHNPFLSYWIYAKLQKQRSETCFSCATCNNGDKM